MTEQQDRYRRMEAEKGQMIARLEQQLKSLHLEQEAKDRQNE